MINYEDVKPVKKEERTHIQRQFARWNKYWVQGKDKTKTERQFKQAVILGQMMEKELLEKYRSR